VLHHEAELGAFIALAIGGDRLARVFETVAVKAVMNGQPVEWLNSFKLRKFVDETRGEKNFGGGARRAVRADKRKLLARRNDLCNPRPAHRHGFVAGDFFQRLVEEIRRRLPFPPEQAMNRVRA
jgi:hypothetical protein